MASSLWLSTTCMHVDDNLYAAASVEHHMKWAMRCSIAGPQLILGENAPDLRPCQPDPESFQQTVSYECCQLGYVTNTYTMLGTIPDNKHQEMLALLQNSWGFAAKCYSYQLRGAAEVLGLLMYFC